jgi:lysophospholipase L1-like esterase
VGRGLSHRRWVLAAVVGGPVAFLLLLVVQALITMRGDYLPDDPGYRVDLLVAPGGSGADVGDETLRLAMIGDSTVAGLGSPTVETSLAGLVAQRVADAAGRPVRVMGYGVSGARTAHLVPEQLPEVAAFAPDVVVAVIGSNDVTHLTMPWRLRQQTAALAAAVDAEVGAPLVVAGIPLFGSATALAQPLRAVVDAYASVLRPVQRDAALEAGASYVAIARDASPRFAGVPEAMSEDAFHPSPIGYGFWADAIAPVVVEAVEAEG